MRTALKHIVSLTYKPLVTKYLSKTRVYRYKDLRLEIPPDVFHPGFFYSTQFLLQYITQLPLTGKTFLELGCGSGLISMVAAKNAAVVTATDINPIAIKWVCNNSRENNVPLEIIESDLFENIPAQEYDIIAINPPYYKKKPLLPKDHAWFCGENGQYFSALFTSIGNYIHKDSLVLFVLFEGCDIEMIKNFAAKENFDLVLVREKQNLLEKNYIFRIEKIKNGGR